MKIKIIIGVLWLIWFVTPTVFLAQEADDAPGKILWTANWSHDGQYIAVSGDDGQIRLFDGKSFELIRSIDNEAGVHRLRWHPTTNVLAVAAISDRCQLIDLDRDTTIHLKGEEPIATRSVAWNASGTLIAIADYEGNITIWTAEGKRLRTIRKGATKSYVAIDWHPQRDEIIALSEYIRVYDLKGNLLHKISHRKESVLMLCVQWHPSGDFFVIGDYGDHNHPYPPLLQFWNADYTLRSQSDISQAEFRNISWSSNSKKLATASDVLRIWSKSGKLLAEGPAMQDLLWGVDWSPDGKYIVTSSINGHIQLWDRKGRWVRDLGKKK